MKANDDIITTSQLGHLGFSSDFCSQAKAMQLYTLQDIFDRGADALVSDPGFSYLWLKELSDYLSQKGLLSLLQPIPGKSAG